MIMDNIINIVVIDSPITKPVDTINKNNILSVIIIKKLQKIK